MSVALHSRHDGYRSCLRALSTSALAAASWRPGDSGESGAGEKVAYGMPKRNRQAATRGEKIIGVKYMRLSLEALSLPKMAQKA